MFTFDVYNKATSNTQPRSLFTPISIVRRTSGKKNKINEITAFSLVSFTVILALIVCQDIYGKYSREQAAIAQAMLINAPLVDDLYIVDYSKFLDGKLPRYKFGILRIKQRSDDVIIFEMSRLAYSKVGGANSDINNIAFSDNYYDEPIVTNLKQLHLLQQAGAINTIIRF